VLSGVYGLLWWDTPQGTVALSFAVALAVATIVDLAYNYVVMKDVEEMVAKHLMLNKDVQDEILKKDKIDEILDCSLESTVGVDLKQVIAHAVINKVRGYKNITRLNVSINVVLQTFEDGPAELKNNFYKLEMITKYHEILNRRRLVFVATEDEEMYIEEYGKTNEDENVYVFLLPSSLDIIKETNIAAFGVYDVKIDGISLHEISEKPLNKDKSLKIIKTFEIPAGLFKEKENKVVLIEFNLQSILAKWEHVFFEDIHKAYSNFQILFDFSNTDIANCDVYSSFVSRAEPHIKRTDDEKKILLFIDDWALPSSMVCFVWYCKNEIPFKTKGGE
jgi:hypothetical protein